MPSIQVAGGRVWCAMGWILLNRPDAPEVPPESPAPVTDANKLHRRAFYPLTMPLTVDPGAISVATTLGVTQNSDVRLLLITAVGHALGILIVAASIYVCY